MLKKFYAIAGAIIIVAISLGVYFTYRPTGSSADLYEATPGTPWTRDGFFVRLDMIEPETTMTLCQTHGHSAITARVEFTNFAGLGDVVIKHANPLISIVVIGNREFTETRDATYVTRTVPSGWGSIVGGYVWELRTFTAEELGFGEHKIVATAVFTLDLEPPHNWIRVVSNTVTLTVCANH